MSATEQEYKNHIKELEQQVRLLKEQVDFLTRKLYGTKSEKTSTLEIEGQMSLFNEIETCADPDAHEPELVEIEKHLRKRKYTGQREELVKNLPHSKVLHTIDEREQICDNCGSTMVKVGEEFVRTEVQFITAKLKVIDHYRERMNAGRAGKTELLIWRRLRCHILPSCILWHLHLPSPGSSTRSLN